jgi:hypothetical protein
MLPRLAIPNVDRGSPWPHGNKTIPWGRLLLALPWALGPVMLLPAAQAGTARARIGVSVTVLAPATAQVTALTSGFEVSARDIRRGYIARRRALRLVVEQRGPVSVAIDLTPTARVFSQVEITTPGGINAVFGASGGKWRGCLDGRSMEPLLLDFRFTLLPGLAPDQYPWPLRVAVRLDY